MLKALLKKQLFEINSAYFMNNKTGKRRSTAGTVGFISLFAFVFLSVAFMFFGIGSMMGDALINGTTDWLFFALMGMMSILLGTFGSVFNTYTSLYKAKDNEMLLSMPIPASKILFVRVIGVFLMSLLYTTLAWIPSSMVYMTITGFTVTKLAIALILDVFITVFVSVLTCLLGWVVALASGRMKNKNIVITILSVAIFALYYYVCIKLNSLLQSMLLYTEQIGSAVKSWIWPIYQLGMAATGNLVSLLLFVGFTTILFAVCCYVLSRTFIRITTSSENTVKAVYREKKAQMKSTSSALLSRELKHYASSTVYMLNTGLGLVILPVLAVLAIIKKDFLLSYIAMIATELPGVVALVPAIIIAGLCTIISTNAVSAPSVSLEGKNIWIAQTLPVDTYSVLKAKLQLHMVLNFIPTVFTAIVLSTVLGVGIPMTVIITVLAVIYIRFSAEFGLMMNLLKPNLTWTNEAYPVKQSMSVFIALFGGWFISLAIFGACFLMNKIMPMAAAMCVCVVVLAAASLLINRWIKNKGCEIFTNL
ncbi:MAG: hypothetical protein Q4C42_02235 [Clostridia bacterium]|nr:hypothetical protein [Clostridia bacterium]